MTRLTKANLKLMNEAQRKVVLTQWDKHQHESYQRDFDVSGRGDVFKDFEVDKGVWDPFKASGQFHASYLFYHSPLFRGKTSIGMGCGTGITEVVMGRYGAKRVIASDISPLAVRNTQANARKYNLDNVEVRQGDLFASIPEKADLIMWNIPFFPGTTPNGDTISASMIMPPELFERFLLESKKHLNEGGVVLVPSYSLGGKLNDPKLIGERLGYHVQRTWTHNATNGIQQGWLYMDELRLRNQKP